MFSIIYTEKFCDCLSRPRICGSQKIYPFQGFWTTAAIIYKDKHCKNSRSGYGLKPSEQIRTVSGDMSHVFRVCLVLLLKLLLVESKGSTFLQVH